MAVTRRHSLVIPRGPTQHPSDATVVVEAWSTNRRLCCAASKASMDGTVETADPGILSRKQNFGVLRQSCSGWLRKRHFEIMSLDTLPPTSTRRPRTASLISSKQLGEFQVSQYKEAANVAKESKADNHISSDHFPGLRAIFPHLDSSMIPVPILRSIDTCVVHFLPKGFAKGSVPRNYFDYTKWSFAASTASSAAMVLSTQAMLYAVGLGAGSIPTAAALNWVLKDGLGQLGGVLFASIVNKRFDSDAKRWRVIAALALDGAVMLQSLTPLFPSLFLPLAALANMGMNVSWLAASASRAGIHLSFAQMSNLADITAKTGSQTTLASTVGMAIGVGISPFVGSNPETIIPCLGLISAIHLGSVLSSLKSVSLNSLNQQRVDMIASDFIERNLNHKGDGTTMPVKDKKDLVLSIEGVASEEVVIGPLAKHLLLGYVSKLPGRLSIGDPITDVADSSGVLLRMRQDMDNEDPLFGRYSVFLHKTGGSNVVLLLEENASSHQVLMAHLHATYLRMALGGKLDKASGDKEAAMVAAKGFVRNHGSSYLEALKIAEWNTNDLFVEKNGGRIIRVSS